MELRSGHRLNPPPPSVDRISDLPDDLLLQVLVQLRCARTAALTSAVARRWRGLWRHLTELSFREMSPDALEGALGQVTRPAISLLEIDIPKEHRDQINPACISALLRAAARLAPTALVFTACGHGKDSRIPIEVPVFHRATSIKLDVCRCSLYVTMPAHGLEFPLLERLSIASIHFDIDDLIQRCPRLRVLEVGSGWGSGKIRVHSPVIEEVIVNYNGWVKGIDIMAPVLKRLRLSTGMDSDFSLSFSAPMVENLRLDMSCPFLNVGIDDWRLRKLSLWKEKSVNTLRLTVDADKVYVPDVERNFSQVIASLPNFSVLQLSLLTRGHIFGSLVFNLLGFCTVIQKLKVSIDKVTCRLVCPPNCACGQPQNWRSETISLAALEEVEIEGFEGTGDEIEILKLLFRCTPLMKTMAITLTPEVLPTSRGCKKTYRILRENPSVTCHVYCSGGEEVLYP